MSKRTRLKIKHDINGEECFEIDSLFLLSDERPYQQIPTKNMVMGRVLKLTSNGKSRNEVKKCYFISS